MGAASWRALWVGFEKTLFCGLFWFLGLVACFSVVRPGSFKMGFLGLVCGDQAWVLR